MFFTGIGLQLGLNDELVMLKICFLLFGLSGGMGHFKLFLLFIMTIFGPKQNNQTIISINCEYNSNLNI
jgi:hypothetical protein